jgi:hypothetical protein
MGRVVEVDFVVAFVDVFETYAVPSSVPSSLLLLLPFLPSYILSASSLRV